MQFGFGVLHLAPDAFWRMTPRELGHAIVAVRGHAATPIARADFDALMRRYPDNHNTVMPGLDPGNDERLELHHG